MFKSTRLWALGLFMTLLAVGAFIPQTVQAGDSECGIGIQNMWYRCEYRETPWSDVEYRYGACHNGDTVVLQLWLEPSCYDETGVLTVTALNPVYGNTIGGLIRPRYLRFMAWRARYIEVKLNGLGLWVDDGAEIFTSLPIVIIPVSAQLATIVDEQKLNVWWEAQVNGPPKG